MEDMTYCPDCDYPLQLCQDDEDEPMYYDCFGCGAEWTLDGEEGPNKRKFLASLSAGNDPLRSMPIIEPDKSPDSEHIRGGSKAAFDYLDEQTKQN